MFLLNKTKFAFVFIGFFALQGLAEAREVRCTFDIGSGETRFSAIAVEKSKTGPTYSRLTSGAQRIAIKRAVVDGVLPDSVIQELKSLLTKFKSACETQGAKAFEGVATSGFRTAKKNGAEALAAIARETGIRLSIVRGDQEARLGYLAVEAQLPLRERAQLVVWDIGGGSQQIASRWGSTEAFDIAAMEEWGAAAFKDKMTTRLGRSEKNLPLAPLSKEDMAITEKISREMARKEVPPALAKKARARNAIVIGIGGVHNEALLGMSRTHVRKGKSAEETTYTLADVEGLKKLVTGKNDDQLKAEFPESQYTQYLPTNVGLVLGIMKELGIRKVRALEVNLTDGLAADESAWR